VSRMVTSILPSEAGAASGRNLVAFLSNFWKVRVVGAHHVPAAGPVLLVSNHTGVLDGPLLGSLSPRPVHVLTRSELFVPPLDSILRRFGQLSLENAAPDRTALRTAVQLLAAERVVGMFPEGHRGRGDAAHVRHGAAYLVAHSMARVVPVAILGTRSTGQKLDSVPRLRATIDLVFGEAFRPSVEGDPRRRVVVARSSELIRQRLADHVRSACARTGQVLPADEPDGPQI
jgi:1-acyl-sn-glycerol-3-phosphate acyltransferase